jgi:hypothetical protein
MESAIPLATIHDVKAFRSSVVASTFFSLNTSSAFRDCIGMNYVIVSIQQ